MVRTAKRCHVMRMNSEKRLRGAPRCGEAADVREVVLSYHIPVRVSPRLPCTRQSFALLQIAARVDERLPGTFDTSTGSNRVRRRCCTAGTQRH